MAPVPQRSWSQRLKRTAVFIGIVWALAASFLVFELVSLSVTDLALSDLETFGDLALSRATQDSTACEVQTGETGQQAAAITAAAARTRSWLLGVNVGRDAQSRQWAALGSRQNDQARRNAEQLAEMLSVQVPGVFIAQQVANANNEFVSFIEGDTDGTAHSLARLYSPDACRIFKLGAFWGYSTLPRMALVGEESIYKVEINYYGRQIGLPDQLTRSLIAPTSADASSEALVTETNALTDAVTQHLSAEP